MSKDGPESISSGSRASASTGARLKAGITQGIRKGFQGFLWIVKILVPVSLAVALLDWTGWLYALDPVFRPIMGLINLPPQAALPILTGVFSSFYAALAMVLVIPFTSAQATLLAIFITIAHMLILEGTIQHKAGISGLAISAMRLFTACVTVFIASQFFSGTSTPVVMPENLTTHAPLDTVLLSWTTSTLRLLLKMMLIIVPVMTAIELLKTFGWTERIARVFRPFMAVLGLSPNVATMWVAGTFFGLIYASAVVVEESTSGRFSQDELRRLHIALSINHSVVEDPALFLAAGISLFWTVVPRFLAGIAAVHLYRLHCRLWPRLRARRIKAAGRPHPEPR